ncbi:MAG: HD domain-containing protein [Phycisphaerales bacterium]|nr:HD domain-containing protein [Phycisphaerales bacterium]
MLRVPISHAKEGMELALPVYNPRASTRLLLKPGAILEQSTIERLIELQLPELWIKYPNMEMVSKYVSPKIMASRAEIVSGVADAFSDAGRDMHARLEYTNYQQAMGLLMARLIDDPEAAIFIGEIADSGSPAIRHGANVGYLCMLMGLRLSFYLLRERKRLSARLAKDVTSLGVAAMLHDIGMTRLKQSTLERWARDHDATDLEWQEHVKIGYHMLKGQVEPSAASAVLHHHQRFDGSGFPKRKLFDGREIGIEGSKIHIFARILLVADLYDRLVHPAYTLGDSESSRESRPPVYALNELMKEPYQSWMDPIVFQSLLSVCPAYAPGTMVELSNGMQAVVTDWDAHDPCRPTVSEVSRFEDDDEFEVINLQEHPEIEIVEADGIDVRSYNFYPKHKHSFDLRMVEKSMSNGIYTLNPDEINSTEDRDIEDEEQAA